MTPANKPVWFYWFSGAFSDTMWSAVWPVNVWKMTNLPNLTGNNAVGGGGDVTTESAGSNHPGGANFAFMDGSVKFLKDTISTWQYDANGNANGVIFGATGPGLFSLAPGINVPVYPALSSRNGGEVISSDAY